MHRFFYISTPGLQKRTFINVHFSKTPPRVEIFIHHHSFGVRPPFLRGYLYDLILYIRSGHVATIMLRNRNRNIFRYFMEDIQNMSQKGYILFMKNYFPKFGTSFGSKLFCSISPNIIAIICGL